MFVVPFLFGSGATLAWGEYWRYSARVQIDGLRRNASRLVHSLPHLTLRTASRHVLLLTIDVEFINLPAIAPPLLREAMVVHLGDDHVPCRAKFQRATPPLAQSLTVPYRVSQWCPLGFPPPSRPKTKLLFVNINPSRHATRGILAAALRARAHQLGVQDNVLFSADIAAMPATPPTAAVAAASRVAAAAVVEGGGGEASSTSSSAAGGGGGTLMMLGPVQAAEAALASAFCLCPTGDSKGFTARFWFSLAHGCLPVRFDGYFRRLGPNATAYPFRTRLDWSRLVVDVEEADYGNGTLLDKLLAIPQAEVDARLRYLRHVRPMLMYGNGESSAGRHGSSDSSGANGREHTSGGRFTSTYPAFPAAGAPPSSSLVLDPPQLLIEELEALFLKNMPPGGREHAPGPKRAQGSPSTSSSESRGARAHGRAH